MRHHKHLPLDERLRLIVREAVAGTASIEDATLLLRAEVLASFIRGRESNEKRAPNGNASHIAILS